MASANGWKMAGGRLIPDAQRTRALSIYHAVVWRAAEKMALRDHCGVTADHLRRGCYVTATEHLRTLRKSTRVTDSSKELDNAAFSHLLALWGDEKDRAGLLIEPDCLTSSMAWDHPEQDAIRGMEAMIEQAAPPARITAICRNAFDCANWRELAPSQKQWLLRTLRGEQKKWHQPVAAGEGPF